MTTNKTMNRGAIPKIIPNQQQPQPRHHQYPRWEIAKFALASRIFLLLAMSLSCSILPDFYPGNNVLQFDLRLMSPSSATPSSSSSLEEEKDHCFCLKGHACCDVDVDRYRRKEISNGIIASSSCADDNSTIHNNADNNNIHQKSEGSRSVAAAARYKWLDEIYAFILPPVTKWDAARFLTLSVDPWARYPPRLDETCDINNDSNDNNNSDSNNDTTICEASHPDNDESRFYPSEQSHAFLPLLPLLIRYTTIAMTKLPIPSHILPPTYESTTALSAILMNTVAFVIAAVSLYDLTIYMLKTGSLENNSNRGTANNDDEASSTQYHHHHLLANTAARLFCINPAGVFFTAAYSESVFAMLTFAGHAIVIRGQFVVQCQLLLLQTTETIETNGIKKKGFGTSLHRCWWWWVSSNFYWMASTALWMLASYTRSNGTFSSIWLVLVGVSKVCSCIIIHHQHHKSSKIQNTAKVVTIQCVSSLLFYAALAFLVAYPVYYHDRRGYNFHCPPNTPPIILQQQYPTTTQSNHDFPTWCDQDDDGIIDRDRRRGLFSLYAHVQRKHWNVGLFRYYEMKQIPNFILALPVLALSFAAAVWWIRYSWSRHTSRSIARKREGPFDVIFRVVKDVVPWAFLALGASSSSCDFFPLQQQGKENKQSLSNTQPSTATTLDGRDIISTMLRGPNFLSYYAILAGFAFVGTFLAHVQISTRLICSSCPAFYWFVTSLISPSVVTGQDGKSKCSGDVGVFGFAPRTLLLMIYFYFGLFNLLGAVMHVNWLPWT